MIAIASGLNARQHRLSDTSLSAPFTEVVLCLEVKTLFHLLISKFAIVFLLIDNEDKMYSNVF